MAPQSGSLLSRSSAVARRTWKTSSVASGVMPASPAPDTHRPRHSRQARRGARRAARGGNGQGNARPVVRAGAHPPERGPLPEVVGVVVADGVHVEGVAIQAGEVVVIRVLVG